MELTKQELKFAEVSAKRYRSLPYRKSQLIGWIGVVLFCLGLLRILPLTTSIQHLLLRGGFFLIVIGTIMFAMTIIGKLYLRNRELKRK